MAVPVRLVLQEPECGRTPEKRRHSHPPCREGERGAGGRIQAAPVVVAVAAAAVVVAVAVVAVVAAVVVVEVVAV